MIYFDNAATTLVKPSTVERSVLNAMHSMASPGRGSHQASMRASKTVYACREAAAELFSVEEPENIIFTMNATHALNIAISSLARRGTRVLVSGYEHNSVTRPLNMLGAEIMTAEAPMFDSAAMLRAFEEKLPLAELAVCTHVSNVFGFVLPIYEIAELCARYAVPLIVDASQSAGILDVDQRRLRAAFIAMPGHKSLFGPQGTGILIASDIGRPLMGGGSGTDSINQLMPDFLPDRHEAGTHNVCGIAGLLEGIRFVQTRGLPQIAEHENMLRKRLAARLSPLEQIELFTTDKDVQSGVLSLRCRTADCESFAQALDEHGICVRAGLHCAPYAHRSAGTLESGTVRFSFSPFNTVGEVDRCAEVIKVLIN